MNYLLFTLQTLEFGVQLAFLSTTQSIYRVLSCNPTVLEIRAAYQRGEITAAEIRLFVDGLIKKLNPGFHLDGNDALSAIAVALETEQDAFAAEYINDLADLYVCEISQASRVARLCQEHRSIT